MTAIGWLGRPCIAAIMSPCERQAADQPDDGLFREGEGVHQLGQIVFEKALALGREERDDLLVVGRIGRGEAEIDLVASLSSGTACSPNATARSSTSENGCGS